MTTYDQLDDLTLTKATIYLTENGLPRAGWVIEDAYVEPVLFLLPDGPDGAYETLHPRKIYHYL